MGHSLGPKLAGSAAALLLTVGLAHGQQQGITAQEADTYFRQIQQEAVDIMRSRDFARLEQWVEANIAEGAVLQASMAIESNGTRKGFVEVTLTKDDMRHAGPLFSGVIRQLGDYSLEVDVTEVVPHGPEAATATVRWTERFSIEAGQTGGEGDQPEQQRPTKTVEAVAECMHLLRRSEGALALGLTTCKGDVRL